MTQAFFSQCLESAENIRSKNEKDIFSGAQGGAWIFIAEAEHEAARRMEISAKSWES